MHTYRVGAATLNQIPLAWEHNHRNILRAIELARRDEVSLLLLPELCIPGYDCEDGFYAMHTVRRSMQMLQDIVPRTEGMMLSVGLPLHFHNALFNVAALVVDARLVGFVAKRFLAGDGIHYEPRWFKAWPAGRRSKVDIDGVPYPIGDISFDVQGLKIGFEICEDAWVANRPGGEMSQRGVDIILNPSGSHFAFGKHEIRKRLVLEGSRAFGTAYVYTNMMGCEAGRAIYDGGALIANAGTMLACGPRFSFQDVCLTSAVVDVDRARMTRARTGSFQPTFIEEEAFEVNVEHFRPPTVESYEPQHPALAPWETAEHLKEEEFSRAEALALFDYLRKSWSSGFVVSLSGGADSSACACLVSLVVQLATAELGLEGFKKKLGYIEAIQGAETTEEIVGHLLTCAYQATRNSGEVTRNAASSLAGALGADYLELDVDEVVQQYRQIVEGAIGRQLTWERDDITLQNIQARVRSPSIWMLANLRNALLLATSNRSEAAVGYATMDGDTSGGLSPIAGIDKDFLRRWLRWMQTDGPLGAQPVPALEHVNVQQPTAELRPQEDSQTDEGDLMPYDLLDAIEGAAIRDKKTPLVAYKIMRNRFPQYDPHQLLVWVERFFKLFARNQWKRERYAPSFHLDDKNLDPKTWFRYPILSGGFTEELAELRSYVAREYGDR